MRNTLLGESQVVGRCLFSPYVKDYFKKLNNVSVSRIYYRLNL